LFFKNISEKVPSTCFFPVVGALTIKEKPASKGKQKGREWVQLLNVVKILKHIF